MTAAREGPKAFGLSKESFSLRFGSQLYLEQFGPKFPGHKKTIAGRVVSDAVQYGLGIVQFVGRDDSTAIDPSDDRSVFRRYSCDPPGMPDVGVDFATYALKLVQLEYGHVSIVHSDPARLRETHWIKTSNIGGSIAHVDRMSVIGESPTLT